MKTTALTKQSPLNNSHIAGLKKLGDGAGDLPRRLRALPALPKVLRSIPSNHMVAQPSAMGSGAFFWPAGIHIDRTLDT